MKIEWFDLGKFLLRLFAGVLMFFAGIEKFLYTSWGGHTSGWTARGFLLGAASGTSLNSWFAGMAGNATIDSLVMWGEVLIGLALILGLLTRLAALFGIIENGLFWIASYKAGAGPWGVGWANGPLELNAALVAMYIFFILAGAGLTLGLDMYIHKMEPVKSKKWLQAIFG